MNFVSLIKSIFGPKASVQEEPLASVDYNGFTILPEPQAEGGQYRVSGGVRKGGAEHHFIRADMLPSRQACADEMIRKARILIDQKGEKIFPD